MESIQIAGEGPYDDVKDRDIPRHPGPKWSGVSAKMRGKRRSKKILTAALAAATVNRECGIARDRHDPPQ